MIVPLLHMRLHLIIALCLLHAALFVLAFPPYFAWPLMFFAPAPLVYAWMRAPSTWSVLLVTLITQWLMWLWIQWWMYDVTALGLPVFAAYLAVWPALIGWTIRRIARAPDSSPLARLPMTLILPITWTAIEFLRGSIVLGGYPWYFIGHPLVEWLPFAQSADLVSAYGVSFLTALLSGVLIDVVRLRTSEAESVRLRTIITAASLAGIALAVNLAYGFVRLRTDAALLPGPTVLVVQTNLPQSNKLDWTLEQQFDDVLAFMRQAQEALEEMQGRGERIDLVAFPETMLPVSGFEPKIMATLEQYKQSYQLQFVAWVKELSETYDVPMLVGSNSYQGLRTDGEQWAWDALYNSAYLLQDGDVSRFDKVALTPFGETMPLISRWEWLEKQLLALGAAGMSFDLDAGTDIRTLPLAFEAGPVEIGAPICFEVTVPRVLREMMYEGGKKHGDLIINLTNDGWFGDDDGARQQHAQIARFRAIENRVPVIRCANTGLSMAIDSCGRITATVGEGRYGTGRRAAALPCSVSLDARSTLFGRIGHLPAWFCLAAVAAMLVMTVRRRATASGALIRGTDQEDS